MRHNITLRHQRPVDNPNMGVRGLQTFLKRNPSVSQNVDLSNTSLVIDGNNLMCCLFCDLAGQRDSEQWRCDIYGGDMVSYSERTKEFFVALEKCNITPILVYDGSVIGKQSTQDQLALKERTIHQRGLERFQLTKSTTEDCHDDRIVLPQTIHTVFRNIAADMGAQRIQTPFEADTHIARVANDLNCPVLTNDSDFIIYSLPQGFIMLDSFLYKRPISDQTGRQSIKCSIYSQSRLVRCLPGLRPETMPLLSILLGNDYVEAGTFDTILDIICRQHDGGSLIAETWNHKKIARLLGWLRHKSLDEAVEWILKQSNSNSRDRLKGVIKMLLRNYKIESTDNFETELEETYPARNADPETNIHPELMPPKYLRRLIEESDLTPISLDIVFHNTHYDYAVNDDLELVSSSYVKYRPYSLATTLLRPKSYSNLTTYRRQIESEKDAFYMYGRVKSEYSKVVVRPMETLEEFGSLEYLNCYSMITLEPALKKTMLMAVFRFNLEELNLMTDTLSKLFTGQFIQESTTCLILIKYIGLEAKMAPKPQFVNAVILTLFYYAALNGNLNKNSCQDSQYGQILLQLRPHAIKNNDRRYESSQTLYRRIVHFISQLQAAYVSYGLVNSLLNHVFPVPRYEKFLNGTLIFRLTKLMRLGELKLEALCHEIPTLYDVCNSLRVMVHSDE